MRARRAVVSLVVGLSVGLVVAGLTEIPRLYGSSNVGGFVANAFNFWGLFFGTFAALIATGVTFGILSRGDRGASFVGRLLAGIALAVLAAAVLWWIAMWRVSPFTLEGWWLYALAITAGTGAVQVLRRRRTGGRSTSSGNSVKPRPSGT